MSYMRTYLTRFSSRSHRTGRPTRAAVRRARKRPLVKNDLKPAVLRTLAHTPKGQSLGQTAQSLNFPRSTIQRIVAALAAEQLISTTNGPGLRSLARATRIDITGQCRPHLTALARDTGKTVDLSVLRGPQMIFIDQAECTGRLRNLSAAGGTFLLTTTANCRACRAALPDQQMLQLASAKWAARRETVDLPAFQTLVANIRQTGLAQDLDAHIAGISALGISFTDGTDHYAISDPIPSSHFAEKSGIVTKALLALKPHL